MSIKEIEDIYEKLNIKDDEEKSNYFPPLQYEAPSIYDKNEEIIISDHTCIVGKY